MRWHRIPYWYLLILPSLLFALGFLMNEIVVMKNGGHMPVLEDCALAAQEQAQTDDTLHICMTDKTRLRYVADWIVINGYGVASPGDFLIVQWDYTFWPALFGWFVLIMKERNESWR